ncbi:MAG: sigma-70 family RNA polymerase sigma factor [Proteobacteria bacterium]|nr:sigma-70 family RNA polymerase sigma factor [Pseudomonadota bacterium]
MSESMVESFLASVPVTLRPSFAAMVDLQKRLSSLYDEGCRQWPQLAVDPVHFVSFLGGHLPADRRASEALAAVRAGDLYLTFACSTGDQTALLAFDGRFMSEIELALARMRVSTTQVEEVKQLVRQKLFVADRGRPGRIIDYSGRGDLRRWVRSIAVRTCLNQMRKGKRELPTQDDRVFDAIAATGDDPELAYMKERYRNEFRHAFEQALKALTDRQQNLLRYHHVDGLNIDEIGAIYRVHRVTAYRWLEKARDALVVKTQKTLRAQLKVEQREFDSIMRLIRSQLHLSLVRYLGTERNDEGNDQVPDTPGQDPAAADQRPAGKRRARIRPKGDDSGEPS